MDALLRLTCQKTFLTCGLSFSAQYPAEFSQVIDSLVAPFLWSGEADHHLRIALRKPQGGNAPDVRRSYSVTDARRFARMRLGADGVVHATAVVAHQDVASAALGAVIAHALAGNRGLVLHASAVVIDGVAHVFVGPSGAGKSTAARNVSAGFCINDDLVGVRLAESGWVVAGLPLCDNSKMPGRNIEAPLAGVHVLNKGPRFHLAQIPVKSALSSLLAQTVIPFPADASASRIVDNLLYLVGEVRCDELTLSRTTDLSQFLGGPHCAKGATE